MYCCRVAERRLEGVFSDKIEPKSLADFPYKVTGQNPPPPAGGSDLPCRVQKLGHGDHEVRIKRARRSWALIADGHRETLVLSTDPPDACRLQHEDGAWEA